MGMGRGGQEYFSFPEKFLFVDLEQLDVQRAQQYVDILFLLAETPKERLSIDQHNFVLGCTLEFIALPNDLIAFVEGRSRIGRLGLIVATATQVAPGFHGVIVLELANAGTIPLALLPGTPIAQLVFQTIGTPLPPGELYRGRFHCQIEP